MQTLTTTETRTLHVTLLEPRLKHSTIFQWFDGLQGGEQFDILNDHDPKPLYYEMLATRGPIFTFDYVENGPINWRVRIRKNDNSENITVGEIVAKDIRKAARLKKLGIDFCCGGKKTLKSVCDEKGLDYSAVQEELKKEDNVAASDKNKYQEWNADFLADYIFNQHHLYYYDNEEMITQLTEKVAARHGAHYPELIQLHSAVTELQAELKAHFAREEEVLFPFIKQISAAIRNKKYDALDASAIDKVIGMMESDHDHAGEILEQIAELTNDFTPPQGACNSFQLLYAKLNDLQDDLHIHVHLENNILFPKVLELQKAYMSNK